MPTAAGLPQQGAERGRRGQRRARGDQRQVVVRVLAADRARGREARPALDREREQKAGAAVAIPDEQHARLEAAALGQSLDISLLPIEALIGLVPAASSSRQIASAAARSRIASTVKDDACGRADAVGSANSDARAMAVMSTSPSVFPER